MVRRHELTDEQWQVIQGLLPASGVKGRPRVDDRRVINGMLFKAKTGIAWRDLPERYGPWKTVYNRFWRWSRNGTLTMLVKRVKVISEAVSELDTEVAVDSTIVRAHQHAAGARRSGGGASRRAYGTSRSCYRPVPGRALHQDSSGL
jgi:transposase